MRASKATRKQLKRHNSLLLLRAVYYGEADNRAALAQITGLAKPTVSDLVGELIEDGLLAEGGHGESTETGGKRPRLLYFVPDARQVIGISIDSYRVLGILANLQGCIVAEHYALLHDAQGKEVMVILIEVINGLIAQLDAPLLCIGVGVPGIVDSENGIVEQSLHLGWLNLSLVEHLSEHFDTPVYIANDTELTALAQFAFGNEDATNAANLVTVLVNNTVEVGVALDAAHYHHGGDIGCLKVAVPGSDDYQPLDTFLNWSFIQKRIRTLRLTYPQTTLPEHGLTYMHIQYAAVNGDALANQLLDELANTLAMVVVWVISLLHPRHIALAGPIVDLGAALLERIQTRSAALLTREQVGRVTFSLADVPNLSAVGAVAQAIQNELDLL
jgi:N-acetylglucosamine repressor